MASSTPRVLQLAGSSRPHPLPFLHGPLELWCIACLLQLYDKINILTTSIVFTFFFGPIWSDFQILSCWSIVLGFYIVQSYSLWNVAIFELLLGASCAERFIIPHSLWHGPLVFAVSVKVQPLLTGCCLVQQPINSKHGIPTRRGRTWRWKSQKSLKCVSLVLQKYGGTLLPPFMSKCNIIM